MKTGLFLTALAWICGLSDVCAQLPPNEEIYILDGETTHFAYGRPLASNRIAIGLTEEGIYELRNDTSVWLIDAPNRDDEEIVRIVTGEPDENRLFVLMLPTGAVADTIGIYNPGLEAIFDKSGKPLATLVPERNRIVSLQGETLLFLNMEIVDKRLAAFFFSYHYLPVSVNK